MTEPQRRKRGKFLLLIVLAMLALTGGAAFSQKTALETWYFAYRLERASEPERQAWADKLVRMDEPAVPRLLGCLRKDDIHLCTTARDSLEKLLAAWGPNDPRSAEMADRFFDAHSTYSLAGQIAALQMLPELLDNNGVETAAKARLIVSTALKDKTAELRYLGIAVATRAELNLLSAVVPLMDDPEAKVRQAAMSVLGPLREGSAGAEQPLISQDELLRWLHDPDPEVRRICEMSLRGSRGRSERDVRFGRMLTDPDPMERLNLLLDLPDEDVDLAVWLKRLSEDPNSAVRAGAARVAVERRVDFADRLEQMTQTDPDGTVRKIAELYRKLSP